MDWIEICISFGMFTSNIILMALYLKSREDLTKMQESYWDISVQLFKEKQKGNAE